MQHVMCDVTNAGATQVRLRAPALRASQLIELTSRTRVTLLRLSAISNDHGQFYHFNLFFSEPTAFSSEPAAFNWFFSELRRRPESMVLLLFWTVPSQWTEPCTKTLPARARVAKLTPSFEEREDPAKGGKVHAKMVQHKDDQDSTLYKQQLQYKLWQLPWLSRG